MKICQISTVHPLNDNRIFHKECKTLVRAGHNVTLIITHDRNEKLEGINVVGLKKRKNRLSRMVLGTFEALCYALKEKADVYHFHDPELIPAGILLKLAGKKVVYDVHENTSQQILNKEWLGGIFKRRLASGLANVAEKLSKILFDVIIAARPDIAEHWHCPKMRVVINAAALETIDKAPEIEISKPRAVVIYAGGLTYIRGIKQLIEAMEIIGDKAQLWLIGKWEDEKFKAECEKLPSFKHVKSLGYMTVGQVYSYMKKSDIAVVTFLPVPNHLTTLPNKPFEYMACCLPVIMSDFEYWKKIFGENVLYANPKSPEEISKQIKLLLNDKELRDKLGRNGREFVEENYSWEAESMKLIEIYNSLANK